MSAAAFDEIWMMSDSLVADMLLTGGSIVDGTGAPAVRGDVAVVGDRITAVGALDGWTAAHVVDCSGHVVCPGFIDTHAHDEALLLRRPEAEPKASQGVTTVITGNCGISLAPLVADGAPPAPLTEIGDAADFRFASFHEFLEAVRNRPAAINAAYLVGHTTVRAATMPDLGRAATADEMDRMGLLVEEAMRAGAIGLSSGLFYPPAAAAPASEVAVLARIAAKHGGVYTAHIRSEADAIDDALQEAADIAAEAGCPLVISHHKLMGKRNFGRAPETLSRIARLATHGPVGFDAYPYTAGQSMLSETLVKMSSSVRITWSESRPDAAGRDLSDIARESGWSVEESIANLSPAGAVYFMMDEEDVRAILSHPEAMIGSDGVPLSDHPHPRLWGTFPRFLGHYVRDVGLVSLEEAIRRVTSLPAARFRLADRGLIAPGCFADLVIFDREQLADTATYEKPCSPAAGIMMVIVNGVTIRDRNGAIDARPGRVLVHDRGAGSPLPAPIG